MKAGVYFVLYLAVILEILIIIVERDEAEDDLFRQLEILANEVVRPLPSDSQVFKPVGFEVDGNRRVRTEGAVHYDLTVKGLKGDPSLLSVTKGPAYFYRHPNANTLGETEMLDLARRGLLHEISLGEAPEVTVNIGKAKSNLMDPDLVDLPLDISPLGKDVGVYAYTFHTYANRIRFFGYEGGRDPDSVHFGHVSLPFELVARIAGTRDTLKIKEKYDRSRNVLLVGISPKTTEPTQLKIDFADLPERWAAGNELLVHFKVEGADPRQVVLINIEPKTLGTVDHNSDRSSWWWKLTPLFQHADPESTVTLRISGKDNRGDPTKSFSPPITRSFRLVLPTLYQPKSVPRRICQGEPFKMNLLVNGLGEISRYKVTILLNGQPFDSVSGDAMYQCSGEMSKRTKPNDQVEVSAFFGDKLIRFYDPSDHVVKPLVIRRSVVRPPPNVDFDYPPGNVVALKAGLRFYAYLGCSYTYGKAFPGAPDLRVATQSGKDVTGIVKPHVVNGPNKFEYIIIFDGSLPPPSDQKVKVFLNFSGIYSDISDVITLQ